MSFNLKHFQQFCKYLMVDTKEEGVVPLGNLLGTQRYLLDEIKQGLNQGQHKFIVLKGRQQGVSTINQALLGLYWPLMHDGMKGSIITDKGKTLVEFRNTLDIFYRGLPEELKYKKIRDNIHQTVFENRSSVMFQTANSKDKGTLGRGLATNFVFGSEISSWEDEEGVASLESSLAEHNPNRLYMFESTARGFNIFYEMWDAAKKSVSTRPVFIGFWRNKYNALREDSAEFRNYWDGLVSTEEAEWIEDVRTMYGYDITPPQIAWFRYMLAEKVLDDVLMFQEFPPTEDYAFQMPGSVFFSSPKLRASFVNLSKNPVEANWYKYKCNGTLFELTTVSRCGEDNAELTIWDEPVEGGVYVAGCDPAYGSSEWADRHCISIWRCYSDKMVQVAEFATDEGNAQQFAWIIAHLVGMYGNCILNLELNGPGGTTFNELQNLQRLAGPRREAAKEIFDITNNIRHYLHRRIDTMGGTFAYQTYAGPREKERMLGFLRSYFESGLLEVRSSELLREMQNVRRVDGILGAEGRRKDDRVIAAALASIAYNDKVMLTLTAQNVTYESQEYLEREGKPLNVAHYMFKNAMAAIADE